MCRQLLNKIIILLIDNSINYTFNIDNYNELSNSFDNLNDDTNNIYDRFDNYNYGISDLNYN
jgi:hypothetical protein